MKRTILLITMVVPQMMMHALAVGKIFKERKISEFLYNAVAYILCSVSSIMLSQRILDVLNKK